LRRYPCHRGEHVVNLHEDNVFNGMHFNEELMAKMQAYREITPAAITLGTALGILMTMSFVYVGLKLGFTIGGSSVAAILGFVFLRGILRRGTIIENNINQTIASGVNIASAGIVFTLPALLLMGYDFNPWEMAVAAIAGSIVGIVVIIPLRKQMIEIDRLRFPSGTAVATILKSPGAGIHQAVLLMIGFVISVFAVIALKNEIIPPTIPFGNWIGLPPYTQTAVAISLMNIGAGMLAGRGGLPFALGGMLSYWLIAPVAVSSGWVPVALNTAELSHYIYSTVLRPLGIGLLIGGALVGIIVAAPSIRGALKSLRAVAESGESIKGSERDEMSARMLLIGFILSLAVLFVGALFEGDIGWGQAAAVAVVGTLWIGISGLIVAQCTGVTDISPISGLSLIAITLMLAITGGSVVVAVMIGVAVCVATSQCADMMQDLKTGHLIGAVPRKQQMVQFSVAWLGPLVAIGTVSILWHTNSGAPGFGPESEACRQGLSDCLSAPQANALRAMIESVLQGNVPIEKYLAGGILGGVLSVVPIGGLGVLVGLAMYLPFPITLGFGIGCVITMIIERVRSTSFVERSVVPLAAGLIIGEALSELSYSMYMIAG
jgi:putative OPT family oligopeptide transporter